MTFCSCHPRRFDRGLFVDCNAYYTEKKAALGGRCALPDARLNVNGGMFFLISEFQQAWAFFSALALGVQLVAVFLCPPRMPLCSSTFDADHVMQINQMVPLWVSPATIYWPQLLRPLSGTGFNSSALRGLLSLQGGATIALVLPYSRRPAGEEATCPTLRRRRLRHSEHLAHLPACLDVPSSGTKVEDDASTTMSSRMADCIVPVDQYALFLSTVSADMLNYFGQRMSLPIAHCSLSLCCNFISSQTRPYAFA